MQPESYNGNKEKWVGDKYDPFIDLSLKWKTKYTYVVHELIANAVTLWARGYADTTTREKIEDRIRMGMESVWVANGHNTAKFTDAKAACFMVSLSAYMIQNKILPMKGLREMIKNIHQQCCECVADRRSEEDKKAHPSLIMVEIVHNDEDNFTERSYELRTAGQIKTNDKKCRMYTHEYLAIDNVYLALKLIDDMFAQIRALLESPEAVAKATDLVRANEILSNATTKNLQAQQKVHEEWQYVIDMVKYETQIFDELVSIKYVGYAQCVQYGEELDRFTAFVEANAAKENLQKALTKATSLKLKYQNIHKLAMEHYIKTTQALDAARAAIIKL